MNNFKNNFRRNRFKSNGDRNFRKRSGNGHKINGEFSNNLDFKRKNPGRNNQNASKLIEKYNDLAKEAISSGDKILSENYLQHADHFARILQSRESAKEQSRESAKEMNTTNSDNTTSGNNNPTENDLKEKPSFE